MWLLNINWSVGHRPRKKSPNKEKVGRCVTDQGRGKFYHGKRITYYVKRITSITPLHKTLSGRGSKLQSSLLLYHRMLRPEYWYELILRRFLFYPDEI